MRRDTVRPVGLIVAGLLLLGASVCQAATRFFVFADINVTCDGGCDPGVEVTPS